MFALKLGSYEHMKKCVHCEMAIWKLENRWTWIFTLIFQRNNFIDPRCA